MTESKLARITGLVMTGLLLAATAWGASNNRSLFKYVAGTAAVPKGCAGRLEVTNSALVFQCGKQSVTAPYKAITQMLFMPRVSKRIQKMKLDWAVKPSSSHSKHQSFFMVFYSDKGHQQVIILKVRNDTMRPYMAEIDLKTGLPIRVR